MNTAENIIPIRGNQQMEKQLPKPLTPLDSDIRDFGDMPVDVSRVLSSKFAATVDPVAGYYGMMLWFASWHRVPAGSLPSDDRQLCHLAGLGRDMTTWNHIKSDALYGWIECDTGNGDSLLFHPVIAEKALVAWIEKLHQRIRSGRGNASRWGCDFSEEADLIVKFHHAWEMLKKANPSSKLILKGNPLENTKEKKRNPTGNPTGIDDGIPGQSQGKVREGKGREGKRREEYILSDDPAISPPDGGERVSENSCAENQGHVQREQIDASAKPQPQRKATLLPDDWELPAEWMKWTLTEKPNWTDSHAKLTAQIFADYWRGKAGKDARKADWFATWRNWVRRENSLTSSQAKPAPAPSKHNGFAQRDYSKGINPDGSF